MPIREIEIYVRGGVVQDVVGIPENIRIKIYDLDIQGADSDQLVDIGDGVKCTETIWEKLE